MMSSVLIDTSCFVHEIPLNIYRTVCGQLDQNDRWQKLAREIGFENSVIDELKQSPTPSSKLLSLWGDQNHTVAELFMAFHRMKENRLMEQLRDLVDQSYHRLIVAKSSSFSSLKAQVQALTKPYNHHKKSNSTPRSDSYKPDVNPFDIICAGIPQISLDELTRATNNWSGNQELGAGAFGTVYRGKWKCTEVAIKRIDCNGYDKSATTKKRLKQVVIEMRFLNEHRHDNILPLYGYSFNGSSACLVYQMMACGSLELRLRHKKLPLTYKQRLNIAIGTARGLQFLHTFHKRATVHGDIKSANILLDSNLQPKIGDFGLACRTSGHTKSKRVYGTHAYLADDFISSLIISTKNDVWAFGVILFELATSLRAYDERRGSYSKLSRYIWAFNESPQRLNELVEGHSKKTSKNANPILMQLVHIGFSCTRKRAADRPEMSDILNSLLEIS
ncbi:serine/threonine-protein kinase pelle-like [Sitodiplosis mosellana]|uniref:serine/threonine-protein kinase pelle-like n=1 Tax=Sitodiplosis mosellana TaxID=263140 RepID=UPI002444AE9C|nr:serine/threonine-protein kinase pelle-like [Sitodiplosis mosellana]